MLLEGVIVVLLVGVGGVGVGGIGIGAHLFFIGWDGGCVVFCNIYCVRRGRGEWFKWWGWRRSNA